MLLFSQRILAPRVRMTALAIAAGFALTLTSSGVAEAGSGDRPSVQVSVRTTSAVYQTVTTHEVRHEPVRTTVIRYDHCGRPCRVEVVTYHTVRVPVTRTIRVYP